MVEFCVRSVNIIIRFMITVMAIMIVSLFDGSKSSYTSIALVSWFRNSNSFPGCTVRKGFGHFV